MSASIIRKLQQAHERLQSGDVAAAASLCEDVLRRAPQNPQALWLLGTARVATGNASDAVPLLERAVERMPQHGAALEHLGLGYLMTNRHVEAERVLRRAAALPGAPASTHMRLGIAVLNQQRSDEAIAHLRAALERDAESALCHVNLGRALAEAGTPDAAREHLERALQLDPGALDALFNLGALALQRGDFGDAEVYFERALALDPSYAEALVSLGIARQNQGRRDEAIACFRRAITIDPGLSAARNNLARALLLQGRPDEARHEYLRAIERAPQLSEVREGLASACAALGRHKEAIVHLRALLAQDAKNARALTALSAALFELGEIGDSEDAAARALAIDASLPGPYSLLAQGHFVRGNLEDSIKLLEQGFQRTDADGLLGMLTHQLRRTCAWEKWRIAWAEMSLRLQRSDDLGSPFWLLHENVTAYDQLRYTQRWADARFAAPEVQRDRQPRPAPIAADRRLRVGYFSSDFQEHALAHLIAGVLERHDRENFEIFAYSYGPEEDTPMRNRLKRACEHFIEVAWEPEDAIVQRIRDDEIDVLVDLKGYTLGARTSVLAQRPCAIQVNWLGYPGTMGTSFIDYLITDGFIVPAEREDAYSERIVRLAHCWQCNDRARPLPDPLPRHEYGLRQDEFVYCCFTQAVKITPEVFACWMRLLKRVPHSVLWLTDDNAGATRNLKAAAQAHGIAAERLVFAPRLPFAQHIARYRAADLALDSFPYTSHSTASDALWAGCPIVGLCGDTFPSRVSGSVLTHAGLPQLITHTLDDYEALAYSLASDPELLARTRAQVAEAKASSLFDAESYTRDLERVYLELAR